MTFVSIFGVAIGVAALIIVLSVMGGFEQDLKSKMLKGQPHLEILNENAIAGFSLLEHPIEKFQKVFGQTKNLEPFTQSDVVLKQSKHLSAVVLFGVDPKASGHLWGFRDSIVEGDISQIGEKMLPIVSEEGDDQKWPGIALGESLAGQLGADLGDEIVVLSPQASSTSSIMAGGTISRRYVVVGVFRTGLFNYDAKWAVVSLDEGRKFLPDYDPSLDREKYVTGVALNIDDPYHIEGYVAKAQQFTGLKAKSWKDTNSALLFALKLEKFTMGSILMLIVLVAAFSISGTMMMTVFHKKTQVCLYRSIGMCQKDVLKMYLLQGFVIGTIGIALGVTLGVGACTILYKLQSWDFSYDFFILKALPVKFLPFDYFIICCFAWLLSVIGSVYPAIVASRQSPSSGLRF